MHTYQKQKRKKGILGTRPWRRVARKRPILCLTHTNLFDISWFDFDGLDLGRNPNRDAGQRRRKWLHAKRRNHKRSLFFAAAVVSSLSRSMAVSSFE
jgi:hypothetical protein